jgi:hypothetical protein
MRAVVESLVRVAVVIGVVRESMAGNSRPRSGSGAEEVIKGEMGDSERATPAASGLTPFSLWPT